MQSQQSLIKGESHELDPPVAWALALEILSACRDIGHPAGLDEDDLNTVDLAIDRLAEAGHLIPKEAGDAR